MAGSSRSTPPLASTRRTISGSSVPSSSRRNRLAVGLGTGILEALVLECTERTEPPAPASTNRTVRASTRRRRRTVKRPMRVNMASLRNGLDGPSSSSGRRVCGHIDPRAVSRGTWGTLSPYHGTGSGPYRGTMPRRIPVVTRSMSEQALRSWGGTPPWVSLSPWRRWWRPSRLRHLAVRAWTHHRRHRRPGSVGVARRRRARRALDHGYRRVGIPGVLVAAYDALGANFLALLAVAWLAARGESLAAEVMAVVAAPIVIPPASRPSATGTRTGRRSSTSRRAD